MTRLDIRWEFLFYFLFAVIFTYGICWIASYIIPSMVPILLILSVLVFGGGAVSSAIDEIKSEIEERRLIDEISSIRKEMAALVREIEEHESR